MTSDNAALDQLAIETDARRGERVLGLVHEFLGRFVSYPSEHARVSHALWIMHAHLMDHWDSTPRLAFLSAEPASGKTRALEVTALLVPNPVEAVNVSPAYLFRKIGAEEGRPTVLFDEIDTVFGPKAKEHEELRGVLNAGHRRGAVAGRCVTVGKTVTTEELAAYCAVAVAGLGWLPDTILTRSVIVRMRRRHAGEVVEPFRHRTASRQATPIRLAIEVWARGMPDDIAWPELPNEIQDRDADVWEALIAVADIVGGQWPARARAAAVALVTAAKEAEPSLGIRLLTDIKAVFEDREVMSSKALLHALHELEESPWGDIRGKPLDERGLARRLKEYSVKSKVVRVDYATPRGYARDDFHDPWSRYLPPTPANSATSATSATVIDFPKETGDAASATLAQHPQHDTDDVADVADVDCERNSGNADEIGTVAHVADVADGDANISRRHKCIHCNERGVTVLVAYDGATVRCHPGCADAWRAAYDERSART